MGSRKGYDFSHYTGSSSQVVLMIDATKRAMKSRPAKVVVATAVDVLALSNPTIATLVQVYKVSKVVYRVSQAAAKNYQKTKDPSKAVAAAAHETLNIGLSEAVSQTIGTTVETDWSAIKETAGVTTSEFQDRLLTSAAKNTIKEAVLPE